jgi:AcrR family transcriptional regulator
MLALTTCQLSLLAVSTSVEYHSGIGKSSSYHHPALRADLLKAAAAELRAFGATGFSLRRIAARARVSHAAPYRHFLDRDEILAALIWETREALATAVRAARERRGASPQARLSRILNAYLDFARANPERLSLVFSETGLAAMAKYPAPPEESVRYDAFGVLHATVKECQAEGTLDPKNNSAALSILLWSIMHGLSVIERGGYLASMARRGGFAAGTLRRLVLKAFDTLVSRSSRSVKPRRRHVERSPAARRLRSLTIERRG